MEEFLKAVELISAFTLPESGYLLSSSSFNLFAYTA
jgi:hypothetical protein